MIQPLVTPSAPRGGINHTSHPSHSIDTRSSSSQPHAQSTRHTSNRLQAALLCPSPGMLLQPRSTRASTHTKHNGCKQENTIETTTTAQAPYSLRLMQAPTPTPSPPCLVHALACARTATGRQPGRAPGEAREHIALVTHPSNRRRKNHSSHLTRPPRRCMPRRTGWRRPRCLQ